MDTDAGPARLRALPMPTPGTGEVLIRMLAAGLNPADWKIADGVMRPPRVRFPLVLGSEGAGTVEQVGAGVDAYQPGDEVFGQFRAPVLHHGTFAEYLVAPVTASFICRPPAVSVPMAAALSVAGQTALVCVDGVGEVAGETVVVLGAGGNIGRFAVQIAARRGAYVIGVARPSDTPLLESLGAAEVVDYATPDLAAALRARHPIGVDVIVDVASERADLERLGTLALRVGGRLVSVGRPEVPARLTRQGVDARCLFLDARADRLRRLLGLVTAGELVGPVDHVLPLVQGVEALERRKRGDLRGKIVLAIA